MHFSTLLSGAALVHTSIAGYVLQDDYMNDFFGNFDFFTEADPTNGHVKFVDQATAQSAGLINSTSTGAISWGVDTKNQAPNGRESIRITSKKSYNSGLVVLDLAHMPTGCGTWPAFWMVGPNWPNSGEIDILEGVNEQTNNAMTLHTGPGCAISTSSGAFSGSVQTSNCDVNAANQDKNAGCSIEDPSNQSYGAGLNSGKGGVFATQWTDDGISVWFFPRAKIPSDALGATPNPSTWGTPQAQFSGACDISKTFKQQQIVFDTTFCGDWAGRVWSSGSCKSKAATCEAYVSNNPSAFTDAFWTINSLKVYSDNGNTPVATSAGAANPSSSKAPVSSGIATVKPSASAIMSSVIPSVAPPMSTLKPATSVALTVKSSVVPVQSSVDTGNNNNNNKGAAKSSTNVKVATSAPAQSQPTTIQTLPSAAPSSAALSSATPSSAAPSSAAPSSAAAAKPSNAGPMSGFVWPSAAASSQGAVAVAIPVSATNGVLMETPLPEAKHKRHVQQHQRRRKSGVHARR